MSLEVATNKSQEVPSLTRESAFGHFPSANERNEQLIVFALEGRWSKNKENLIRSNVDLANLRNKRPSKKKQRTAPMIVQREFHTHVFSLEKIEETSSLYVSDSEATMDDRSLVG